jgi:hypothetical protein
MSPSSGYSGDFAMKRSRLWAGMWALRGGRYDPPITKNELQREVHLDVPEHEVRFCLRVFSEQGLIECLNSAGNVIDKPSKESDFEQFRFTAKAARVGTNYDPQKNYDLT